MPFDFLKRLRTPSQRTVSRSEWENIIRLIVMDFEELRVVWFAGCLALLKERESEFRSNPRMAGEAELATIVIQCADALEFIANKRYVQPDDGRDFATRLFIALVQGKDVRLAQELYRLHLKAQGKNEEGELIHLCGLVYECIFDAPEGLAAGCLKIGGTIPTFTQINYHAVARAFNDHETLRELEKHI